MVFTGDSGSRARFIHATATGIDPERKLILFDDRPPLPFDVLSVDVGITPAIDQAGNSGSKDLRPFARLGGVTECILRAVVAGAGGPGIQHARQAHRRVRPTPRRHARQAGDHPVLTLEREQHEVLMLEAPCCCC